MLQVGGLANVIVASLIIKSQITLSDKLKRFIKGQVEVVLTITTSDIKPQSSS